MPTTDEQATIDFIQKNKLKLNRINLDRNDSYINYLNKFNLDDNKIKYILTLIIDPANTGNATTLYMIVSKLLILAMPNNINSQSPILFSILDFLKVYKMASLIFIYCSGGKMSTSRKLELTLILMASVFSIGASVLGFKKISQLILRHTSKVATVFGHAGGLILLTATMALSMAINTVVLLQVLSQMSDRKRFVNDSCKELMIKLKVSVVNIISSSIVTSCSILMSKLGITAAASHALGVKLLMAATIGFMAHPVGWGLLAGIATVMLLTTVYMYYQRYRAKQLVHNTVIDALGYEMDAAYDEALESSSRSEVMSRTGDSQGASQNSSENEARPSLIDTRDSESCEIKSSVTQAEDANISQMELYKFDENPFAPLFKQLGIRYSDEVDKVNYFPGKRKIMEYYNRALLSLADNIIATSDNLNLKTETKNLNGLLNLRDKIALIKNSKIDEMRFEEEFKKIKTARNILMNPKAHSCYKKARLIRYHAIHSEKSIFDILGVRANIRFVDFKNYIKKYEGLSRPRVKIAKILLSDKFYFKEYQAFLRAAKEFVKKEGADNQLPTSTGQSDGRYLKYCQLFSQDKNRINRAPLPQYPAYTIIQPQPNQ